MLKPWNEMQLRLFQLKGFLGTEQSVRSDISRIKQHSIDPKQGIHLKLSTFNLLPYFFSNSFLFSFPLYYFSFLCLRAQVYLVFLRPIISIATLVKQEPSTASPTFAPLLFLHFALNSSLSFLLYR